jgi:hypothetical protein
MGLVGHIRKSPSEVDSNTRGITHEIRKLTWRSGEGFAVDLACAQYGYLETSMEWKEYDELCILYKELQAAVLLQSL